MLSSSAPVSRQCQGIFCKLAEQAHRRPASHRFRRHSQPHLPQEEVGQGEEAVRVQDWRTSPPLRGEIASNLVAATNYGSLHPYGEVMTEETLENISRQDLVEYHKTYFRPNAGYLIVVGDITPDEAYAKANAHFGKWYRGDIPLHASCPPNSPREPSPVCRGGRRRAKHHQHHAACAIPSRDTRRCGHPTDEFHPRRRSLQRATDAEPA